MPLFDFHCTSCDRVFEALVRGEARVSCPDCGAVVVERLQPVPARPASRGGDALPDLGKFGPPSGGGCCGGGACGH